MKPSTLLLAAGLALAAALPGRAQTAPAESKPHEYACIAATVGATDLSWPDVEGDLLNLVPAGQAVAAAQVLFAKIDDARREALEAQVVPRRRRQAHAAAASFRMAAKASSARRRPSACSTTGRG